MAGTQGNRFVAVSTPLGSDVLLLRSLSVTESLGRLFEVHLELLSVDDSIVLDDLLGQVVTATMDADNETKRYFNGFCTEFEQTGSLGDYSVYHAVLRPWLWFLTRTADCRIFQEQTVPDIIKSVFREHGFSDFEESLSASYRTWEYCVQYRETDFNFVSRLMEQEGIYYFFKHEDGKHTLVLADSYGAHDLVPGYGSVPLRGGASDVMSHQDCVFAVRHRKAVKPGNYVLESYDFKKPKAELLANASIVRGHSHAEYEVFDYPGEYLEKADGDQYVRSRIEEQQAAYERIVGDSNTRGFFPGGLFALEEASRGDLNREYLLVSVSHSAHTSEYESLDDSGGPEYSCEFEAVDSKEPFRTPRTTRKPTVQGPQTAVVVGPSGEEIHTDEYGRVKVQFHWDRYGKADENSSCWVRVSQVWAGKQWGAMHIPRMGHEVIIDFLEGDPDQPIITGRVYNADNMPPYSLPDNKTQSGIKSRSSKSGTPDNFNEIRFEDKKGSEEMYLHAEKNQTIMVENDKSETVGHDNTESIGNDEKISVGNNRDKDVGVDQTEAIGSNKTITVGIDHTETIGANQTESIGSNKTLSVGVDSSESIGSNKSKKIGSNYDVNVGSNMTNVVGSNKSETVGSNKVVGVGSNSSETVGSDKSVQAGSNISAVAGKNISEAAAKDVSVSSGKKMSLSAGDDFSISGGKKGTITIKDQLTIKVGKAQIMMKKNGDITIKGKKINAKGSSKIIMKAKKILQN